MLLQYTAGIVGNLAAKGALPLSLVAIKKLDIIKGKLSEWRTIGRFLGLLEMARWGFSLSKKSSWIEWAQWASSTPIPGDPTHADQLTAMSFSHGLLSVRACYLPCKHRVGRCPHSKASLLTVNFFLHAGSSPFPRVEEPN